MNGDSSGSSNEGREKHKRQKIGDDVETVKLVVQDAPHALVSCFDDCDRLVEVDLRLLKTFNCRLLAVIRHDPPAGNDIHTNRPFWRSNMTRAMLTTFIRSLEHGEMSLGKNVSIAEAMTTFEYENVPIGVPLERKAEVAMIRQPSAGAVFQKRAERIGEVVLRTSEQIAHAIARWPRLEVSLDGAISGLPVNCTCTSTRAWIRFCKKPQIGYRQGADQSFAQMASLSLARKWPQWIQATLNAFGIMHFRLVRDKLVDEKGRDQPSFCALQTSVMGDALGCFFATAVDWPRHSMDRNTRREQAAGETFSNTLRQTILDSGGSSSSGTRSEAVLPELAYARACMSLAEMLLYDAPSPSSIFSGQCCDDNGKSSERTQFARSLSQRGIRVVRWLSDDDKAPSRPLVFPPNWSDGPGSGSVHCSVLLDFADRR